MTPLGEERIGWYARNISDQARLAMLDTQTGCSRDQPRARFVTILQFAQQALDAIEDGECGCPALGPVGCASRRGSDEALGSA